jgi:hypothetical protein
MFGWNSRRNQLLQEFETHIEIETEENIEAGMPREQARQAARKKFGNVLLAAEESRVIWGGLWLERLLQDVRYAVRIYYQSERDVLDFVDHELWVDTGDDVRRITFGHILKTTDIRRFPV